MYAFSGIDATEDKVGSTPDTATDSTRSPSGGRALNTSVSGPGDRFWNNIVPSFVKRDAVVNTEGKEETKSSSSTLFSCCWCGNSGTTK